MIGRAVTEILSELSTKPASTIIIGDFNMDLNAPKGEKLRNLMMEHGLKSCLQDICSTTKAGTQIDCVFSDILGIEAYVTSTLTSHHEPLLVFWPSGTTNENNDMVSQLLDLRLTVPCTRKTTDCNTGIPAAGLVNPPGMNLCFANSAVQALCRLQGFLPVLQTEFNEATVIQRLSALGSSMLSGVNLGDVSNVLSSLAETNVMYRGNRQHDAMEFIELLLDKINEEAFIYSTIPEIVNDSLRIQMSDSEMCTNCHHNVETIRATWSIALGIPNGTKKIPLDNLFQIFQAPTATPSKTCPSCTGIHDYILTSTFRSLPNAVILHLARFLHSGEKVDSLIDAPHNLELKTQEGLLRKYELRAVISHFGSAEAGHYVAAVSRYNTQDWTMYDDSRVDSISKEDVITKNAYILMYEISP